MYYPFFRGKQYELVTIRETADLMANSRFVPIIEPVKESLSGLERALDAVGEAGGKAIVVVNPTNGDLVRRGGEIEDFLDGRHSVVVGVFAGANSSAAEVAAICSRTSSQHDIAILHAGFPSGKRLSEEIGDDCSRYCHVFFEKQCGKLYRRPFKDAQRVLIRDGFQKKTNRDYAPVESFSDLHVTYEEESMDGFGDFLIVGDEYSEAGGPAYAVAIHLTAIDVSKDDQMDVYHFVSERVDTPKDPAGKFLEALEKLKVEVEKDNSPLLKTEAVEEYLRLFESRHFPGLGYAKKLSMKHHIETISRYFEDE